MSRNLVSIALLLVSASVVCADVMIDLRPDAPAPYEPGQAVNIEVYFVDDGTGHPITGNAIEPRGYQIDFSDTDAGIGLPSDMVLVNPGGINIVFTVLPRPALIYPLPTPIPGLMPLFPAGGQMLIGSIDVTVNDAGWLRVLSSDEWNPNYDAWLQFGYGLSDDDPVTTWRAYTGEITGGEIFLPEPVSLILLALGGLATLSGCRGGARREKA